MRDIKRVKIKTVDIEVHSIEVLSNDMYDQWLNSLFLYTYAEISLCTSQSYSILCKTDLLDNTVS